MRSIYSEPKLYPVSLSIEKKWFISYKDFDGLEQKVYGRMAHYNTVEDRMAEANRLLRELNSQRSHNLSTSLNGSLIKHLEMVVDARCNGKKRATLYGYHSKLKIFTEWYRKHNCPPVNEMMGQLFLNWLSKREQISSNTTINDHRRQLKTFFADLIEYNLVTINPFVKTKKLPQRTSTKSWFRKPIQMQLKKLMLEQGDDQLWLCCMIQFYCFVRPGNEMREIRVSDIIREEKKWKMKLPGTSSKTGKYRYIPIPDQLKDLLINYVGKNDSDDYLFSRDGTPGKVMVGRNFFYHRHRIYMKYLGLGAGYSLYGWKNTGAVMMYKQGAKLKYISMLMGHSSIEITDEYFKSLGIDDVMDEITINYPTIE